MAIRKIVSRSIGTDVIAAEDLAANSVTVAEISDGAVSANKLASDSVTTVKIADGAVTGGKLAAGAAVPLQSGNSGKVLTTDGTDASWTTVENTLTSPTSNRNMIYNGAMEVNQRGDQTGLTNGSDYALDRWELSTASGSTFSVVQRSNAGPLSQFKNSMRVTCTSAGSTGSLMYMRQRLEGQDTYHLGYGGSAPRSTTLSYWVKSNVTGTFSAGLVQHSTVQRGFYWTYDIDTADTWTYVTVNIDGDASGDSFDVTTMVCSLDLFISGTNGSLSGTLESWGSRFTDHGANTGIETTNNDYLEWTGVQWELGDVATDFEHRKYGEELALCQRYFSKISSVDCCGYYVPAQNAPTFNFSYPQTMRATPTITINRQSSDSANLNSITQRNQTADSFNIYLSGSGEGMVSFGHNGNEANFEMDAEL